VNRFLFLLTERNRESIHEKQLERKKPAGKKTSESETLGRGEMNRKKEFLQRNQFLWNGIVEGIDSFWNRFLFFGKGGESGIDSFFTRNIEIVNRFLFLGKGGES